jgi:hypothetical protein
MSDPFGVSKSMSERQKQATAAVTGSVLGGAALAAPGARRALTNAMRSNKLEGQAGKTLAQAREQLARAKTKADLPDSVKRAFPEWHSEAMSSAEKARTLSNRARRQSLRAKYLAGEAKGEAAGAARLGAAGVAGGAAVGGGVEAGRERMKKADSPPKVKNLTADQRREYLKRRQYDVTGKEQALAGGGMTAALVGPYAAALGGANYLERRSLARQTPKTIEGELKPKSKPVQPGQVIRLSDYRTRGQVPNPEYLRQVKSGRKSLAVAAGGLAATAAGTGAAVAGERMNSRRIRSDVTKSDPFGISKANARILSSTEQLVYTSTKRAKAARRAKAIVDSTGGPAKQPSRRVTQAWDAARQQGRNSQAMNVGADLRGGRSRTPLYVAGGTAAGAVGAGGAGAYAYKRRNP